MIRKVLVILLFPCLSWAANFTVSNTENFVYVNPTTERFDITFQGIDSEKTYTYDYSIVDYCNNVVTSGSGVELTNSGTNTTDSLDLSVTQKGWFKVTLTLNEDGSPIDATNVNIADVNGLNTFFTFSILGAMPTQGQSSPFGICEHFSNDQSGDLMQKAGIKWQRMDTSSSTIYPAEDTYDWTSIDGYKSYMDIYGIYYLPLVAYGLTGSLSTGATDRYLPVINPHWNNYINALVTRYKDDCPYWEVWNEPNLDIFWKSSESDFYSLLNSTYDSIKNVDSSLIVLHGGWSGPGDTGTFTISSMNNNTNKFDRYNTHPYDYGANQYPENEANGVSILKSTDITRMTSLSSKPRWITEYGYPTYTGQRNITEQCQWSMRSVILALSNGLEKFFLYEFKNRNITDSAIENSVIREDNFGLVYYDYEPKPAYTAYANLIRQLAGKTFVSRTQPTATSYNVKFSNTTHDTYCLWSTGTESVNVNIGKKHMKQTDIMGVETNISDADGNYTLSLTGDPIYLTTRPTILGKGTYGKGTWN